MFSPSQSFLMTRFVVFLRALNVGGHNIVKGKRQEAFFSMGFRDVSTYNQSGNIILARAKLPETLGFEVGGFVRTISQLKMIIKLDPFNGCR
jgi:uncharacterized protein (DUF1697 family)